MATRKKPIKRRKTKPTTRLKQKLLMLKAKVTQKFKYLADKSYKLLKAIGLITILTAGVLSFAYLTVKAPEYHEDFLTAKMGPNVVVLTGFNNFQSGGTGFQMETKYGLRVISNAHVCEINDNGYVLAHTTQTMQVLKVLKIDDRADLCMLSKVDGLPGLKLGSKPEFGDTIGILGHPLLEPQTFSKGRILAKKLIRVVTGWYNEKTCTGPGAQKVPTFFGSFCVKPYMSYYTSAMIFPGNSGSPAVNFYGQVVGVVFAGNNATNYGYLVPYEDLRRFINE